MLSAAKDPEKKGEIVERRRFGKTEMKLSLLGIGGIPIMNIPAGDVESIISRGIGLGVNFVETARGYGESEEKIGAALKGRRKDVFIITKGHAGQDLANLEKSLRALSVDFVDVYQLHGVVPGTLKIMEGKGILDKLLKAREDGKFKHLGLTVHHPESVYEAFEYDIFSSLQAPINFVEYDRYERCMTAALGRDYGILAMKPLGGGVFPARESLRFLKFTPVSAIPVGVSTPGELEEDAEAVSSDEPLTAGEKKRLEAELAYWGDRFCRKCDYCRGCPERIPTNQLMLTEIIYRRNGVEQLLAAGYAKMLKLSEKCTNCGECVEKCPYGLKIPETIRRYREEYLPVLEKEGS